jgi:hypothetical protein
LFRYKLLGFSQASVTAGLIGGRLGNKGGVAISLKLEGTTFLFLNVHLAGAFLVMRQLWNQLLNYVAAHEEKVALRISNLTKIKVKVSSMLGADSQASTG